MTWERLSRNVLALQERCKRQANALHKARELAEKVKDVEFEEEGEKTLIRTNTLYLEGCRKKAREFLAMLPPKEK